LSQIREITANSEKKGERTLAVDTAANPVDNGGRRLGYERRQFDYSVYFPERRIGRDRRTQPERRIDLELSS